MLCTELFLPGPVVRSQHSTCCQLCGLMLVVCAAAMLVYVTDTKRRDATEFNERLVKDRHTTARNLRNYYLKCLTTLLDADFDQYV